MVDIGRNRWLPALTTHHRCMGPVKSFHSVHSLPFLSNSPDNFQMRSSGPCNAHESVDGISISRAANNLISMNICSFSNSSLESRHRSFLRV